MFGLKPSELLILLVIALLLFGGTKVAALGSGLGQAIRNFKKGMSGDDEAPAKPALQTASSVDANTASRNTAHVNKDA